ncbi:MAG: DUF4388 domain-containing protein [Planctomycetota bacterium]
MLEISGSLEKVSLTEVLQMLTASALSGRLNIECGSRVGAVQIRRGSIVGAQLGSEPGLRAIVAMQIQGHGRFWFSQDDGACDENLRFSNDGVLLELCRIKDEIERARATIEEIGQRLGAQAVLLLDAAGDMRLCRRQDATVDQQWTQDLRSAYDFSNALVHCVGGQSTPFANYSDDFIQVTMAPVPMNGLLCVVRSIDQQGDIEASDFEAALFATERFLTEPLLGAAP